MNGFRSEIDISALPEPARGSWESALQLAAEKRGRVWIAENGQVVAELILVPPPPGRVSLA